MARFTLFKSGIFVFLLALATIHGPSLALLDNWDVEQCVDCQTYLGLSSGDFNQSPVRRYRVIVPIISAGIEKIISPLALPGVIGDNGTSQSLLLAYLLVNNILVALFGYAVFLICMHYTRSFLPSLIGMMTVLTCRWAFYAAGLPLVDSLYLLITSITLLGIIKKEKNLLVIAIFLGPWAKESFILMAPLIFIFGQGKKRFYLLWFFLSGVLVVLFRYLFDSLNGFSFWESFVADSGHLGNILTSVRRLFSLHGIYEIFSVTGFWLLIILAGISNRESRKKLCQEIPGFWYWFLLVIIAHALLSTELARMLYLGSPFVALLTALSLTKHPRLQKIFTVTPDIRVR